jgi:hypothetical protein
VLEGIAATHDNLAVVAYHTWWPGSNDPMYRYNVTDNRDRINYYGADYTPHLWIDGNVDGQYYTYSWENQITTREGVSSPIAINMIVDYDHVAESGTVTAVMSATQAVSASNLRLRLALTESHVPGSGNYSGGEFNYALRDMIPTATGTAVSIAQGDVVSSAIPFALDLAEEDFNNLELVAWVQSDTNHEVLQAAKFHIQGANVTISPTSAVSVPKGGTFYFDTQIVNNTNGQVSGDFWLSVILPGGAEVVIPEANLNYPNPLAGPVSAWGTFNLANELYVPTQVPSGIYTLVARIGQYPNMVIAESSFDFEIVP